MYFLIICLLSLFNFLLSHVFLVYLVLISSHVFYIYLPFYFFTYYALECILGTNVNINENTALHTYLFISLLRFEMYFRDKCKYK